MTVDEAMRYGMTELKTAGISEPRKDAALLLKHVIRRDRSFLIAHPEYQLTEQEVATFAILIARRATREPIQYVTGHQEFFGIDFYVDRSVLIPRPETEILVETAIDFLKDKVAPRFVEVGTGSGCISIAVLSQNRAATAVATDISEVALKIARRNAELHRVSDRLNFVLGDLFGDVGETGFDLIVSNPPYVPTRDRATLQSEVRDFEPSVSLYGGEDGLDVIRRIIRDAPNYLNSDCALLMEIGWDQAERVRTIFDRAIWKKIEFIDDFQGIPRIVKAIIGS